MQMREAGDDPHVRIAIQRTASYLSEDQQHHCLGSLQPNGVQALELQELLYEFWISTACCIDHPELALNSLCDRLPFQLPFFPAFPQSKFCSKSSTLNFDTLKNTASFLYCPATLSHEIRYLDNFRKVE